MLMCTTALLRRTAHALLALVLVTGAFASSLLVYPFTSQDPLLGVAMADEVAAAFQDQAVVFGPDLAAGVVPPLVVTDGYINLSRVLGGDVWTGPSGPALLLGGAGVTVAVSGAVEQYEERTVLRLEIASAAGTRRAELSAEPGDRARLVRQALWLIAAHLGLDDAPQPVPSPDITGDYEEYVRSVGLAATGLVVDAAAAKPSLNDGTWPVRGAEFQDDLRAVTEGDLGLPHAAALPLNEAARRLARRAFMALSLETLHEAGAERTFGSLAELTGVGVAYAWTGILAFDRNDSAAAAAAFQAAAEHDYPYGLTLLSSLRLADGNVGAALDLVDGVVSRDESADPATLTGAYTVALLAEDVARQKAALHELHRAAPYLAYPLQELSFIAFDEDDALAAARALAVAVELEPDSSLFWTNLGWAKYLLGLLDESAQASERAIAVDGNAYIAAYNLGLVHAVHGRLDEALESYEYAVALDPAIQDEVIEDLVNARQLYPGVSAVEYALARLYEAKGQRQNARVAYSRFLQFARSERRTDDYAAFVQVAEQRIVALDAPPPPLEIFGEVSMRLGQRGPDAQPFHPGDPVYPSFELSTPGDQLPALVEVTLSVQAQEAPADEAPAVSTTTSVEIPVGAVGYVVDFVDIELPADLLAGDYTLLVHAASGEELTATARAAFRVAGDVVPLRQLFGRNVIMTGLEIDAPLYGRGDLANSERVVENMVQELRDAAPAAEAALPTVVGGRYDGLSGAQLFLNATADEVEEFLAYVAGSDARDSRFTFVDAFAQWAIDGAPAGL